MIATIHQLYAMVQNNQQWDLGEPDLNERGQPAIYSVASKLGCMKHNSDEDLPAASVFPEDEASLAKLAHQLGQQEQKGLATQSKWKETEPEFDSISVASFGSASSHTGIEDMKYLAYLK